MNGFTPLKATPLTVGSSLLILCALLGAWELAVRIMDVPAFIVPAPSAMLAALYAGFASGLYFEHIGVTLFEIITGFVLGSAIGLLVGIGIATNRYFAFFVYPYVIVIQSTPKIAIAPLIVLWFGLGMSSKVVSGALICFFAVMVNTAVGLRTVEQDRVDLIRALGGSSSQVFWMLRLPTALTYIMAGLEVALTFAVIGVIVAEFIGAERGLGMLMQNMNSSMDVAGSFSILIILAAIGLILNRVITFARHKLIYWERRPTQDGAAEGDAAST